PALGAPPPVWGATPHYLRPGGGPARNRPVAVAAAPATRELVTAARARGDGPRTSRAAAGYPPRRRRPGTGSATARPDTA
ncbi:hypothetical protein, partial [Streptomyces sp. NPDC059409]|uniref:hypothetical protein n=1 Tax=Streptomyces sp. NPDC059409 TaxID=3346824 RepID=UPI0036B7D6AC